jgi:hypothetical protein
VPELVVDALEAGEVEQREAERVARAAGALDLLSRSSWKAPWVRRSVSGSTRAASRSRWTSAARVGAQARAVAGDERGAQPEQRDDHGRDDRLSDEDVLGIGIGAVGHDDVDAQPGQPQQRGGAHAPGHSDGDVSMRPHSVHQ